MEKLMTKGNLWTLKVRRPGVLTAAQGTFWLTRRGDPTDYFISNGQNWGLPAGEWLIQALEPGALGWEGTWKKPYIVLPGETWGTLTIQGLVR